MPWLLAYPTDARGSNIDELLIKGYFPQCVNRNFLVDLYTYLELDSIITGHLACAGTYELRYT